MSIEHLSDQLEGYSNEVYIVVKNMQRRHDLSFDDAMRIVELATRDMLVDTVHHLPDKDLYEKYIDSLGVVSSSLSGIEESVTDLASIVESVRNVTPGGCSLTVTGIIETR